MSQILFSQVSQPRQALIRLCQAINYGSIENLQVEHAEPVFDPQPAVLRNVKLDSDEEPRPEVTLTDFVLSDEVVRLISRLDEMKCGTIRHIEVRAGIPRRIVLDSRMLAHLEGSPPQVKGSD